MQRQGWKHQNTVQAASLLLLPLVCVALRARCQSASQQQGARAQQIQLSGRDQGNVSAQQSAVGGTSGGVNTVQPEINISGRYTGSTSDPGQTGAPGSELSLSFDDAIQRGLRFNLGTVSADNSQRITHAARLTSLSQILPSVTGRLSETVAQSYLPSIGLTSKLLGGMVPIPAVTGQFHFYTAQGEVSEDALDLTAIYNLRSANLSSAAGRDAIQNARELVILAVGGSYVQAISSAALIDAQRDEVRLADANYKQAEIQHRAGTRPAIDANRSLVELRTEQLRLGSDEADFTKQKIRLARLIGLPPSTPLLLTTQLDEQAAPPGSIEEMIAQAQEKRPELKAAEHQMQAAASAQRAAKAEYLPSLSITGSYGLQGTSTDVGRVAYQGVASLNIPIWQGGRVKADTAQADAVFSQRRAEFEDEKAQVEADVRDAYVDLNVALEQVKVALENKLLARETLKQSTDRFASGVVDSVEVVQSEQTLSSSEQDYISSLYAQTLAELHLAQASGSAASTFPHIVKKGSN